MFHLSIDWAQSLYMMARVTLAAVLAGDRHDLLAQ